MWDTVWGAALPKKSFREKKAGKGGACVRIFDLPFSDHRGFGSSHKKMNIRSILRGRCLFCGKERLYRRKKSICGSGANFPFLFPPSFLCWHFKRRLFLSLFHSSSFLRKMEFRNWSLRSKREDNDCADSPIRNFFCKSVLPDPVRHRVSFLPSWRIRRRNLFSFFVVFTRIPQWVHYLLLTLLHRKKDFFLFPFSEGFLSWKLCGISLFFPPSPPWSDFGWQSVMGGSHDKHDDFPPTVISHK